MPVVDVSLSEAVADKYHAFAFSGAATVWGRAVAAVSGTGMIACVAMAGAEFMVCAKDDKGRPVQVARLRSVLFIGEKWS